VAGERPRENVEYRREEDAKSGAPPIMPENTTPIACRVSDDLIVAGLSPGAT
jgi:hypothetical protein